MRVERRGDSAVVVDLERLPRGLAYYRPPLDRGLRQRLDLPDQPRMVIIEEDGIVWLDKKPFLLPGLWCKVELDPEAGRWYHRALPLRCLQPLGEA